MEDHEGQQPQQQQQQQDSKSANNQQGSERSEPVRSRWTPKPEQILILESIFNSGMVNPPKDETVRIRKLLEKFGTVGDANVFYWFQNRRSRSRRRQRQIQATLNHENGVANNTIPHQHQHLNNPFVANMGFGGAANSGFSNSSYISSGVSSSFGGGDDNVNNSSIRYQNNLIDDNVNRGNILYQNNLIDGSVNSGGIRDQNLSNFFTPSSQMGFLGIDHHASSASSSILYPTEASNVNYNSGYGGFSSGFITVFINGVATEVPRGPMDIKGTFGEDAMLLHSSGVSVPTNEFGFLMQGLQHGESYFLVSKQTQV